MAQIDYLRGDATVPRATGTNIIAHICNDEGRWGKGFVEAVSRRWPEVESAYRRWHRNRESNDFALGAIQMVDVGSDTWIANMIGQHGIRTPRRAIQTGPPPIRYEAVSTCLHAVAKYAVDLCATVQMPRIGCGLAGGQWEHIEPLIAGALLDAGISVSVYDLPERNGTSR